MLLYNVSIQLLPITICCPVFSAHTVYPLLSSIFCPYCIPTVVQYFLPILYTHCCPVFSAHTVYPHKQTLLFSNGGIPFLPMLQMYLPLFQKSLSPSRTLSPNTSRVLAFTGPCLLCTCNDKAGLIFLSAESHLSSLFSGCVFFL